MKISSFVTCSGQPGFSQTTNDYKINALLFISVQSVVFFGKGV